MVSYTSNAAVIAGLDTITALVDAGTTNPEGALNIYDGVEPADADAPLGGATLLAELPMSNPAFQGAIDANPGALAVANPITDDTNANATGVATFFRIVDRDGNAVFQGTVTGIAGGGELELNTTSIQAGATVSVTSMTATLPES